MERWHPRRGAIACRREARRDHRSPSEIRFSSSPSSLAPPPTIKGGRLRFDGEERTTWEPRRCTATAPVVTPAIWVSRCVTRSAGRGQRARDIGPTSTLWQGTRPTWTMEPCDEAVRTAPTGAPNPSSRLIMCRLCNRICHREVETLSARADAKEAKTFRGEWQIGREGWICPKCVLRRESAGQNERCRLRIRKWTSSRSFRRAQRVAFGE